MTLGNMNIMYLIGLYFLLLMVLSGCVVEKQSPMPQSEKIVTRIIDRNAIDSECGGLLVYYGSLTGMSEKMLAKEKIKTRRNLTKSASVCNQLKFVLFSQLPESDAKNGKEVTSILEDLSARKHMLRHDERQLVELLSDQLELRARLRERLSYCDVRNKAMETALSEEMGRSEQLNEELNKIEIKLMKLKSIDKKHDAKEKEILLNSTIGDKP